LLIKEISKNKKAYIAEVFSGIQGEGPWVGFRQIFLRFMGCDLRCQWCDTPDSLSIKAEDQAQVEQNAGLRDFSKIDSAIEMHELAKLISKLDENQLHHSLSLTGGEPLLQADFINELLQHLKNNFDFKPLIYLETGGHRPEDLKKILHLIDFISFDIKLPSSTAEKTLWEKHKSFIEIASTKNSYAKIVLTASSEKLELEMACNLLKEFENCQLVLQPAFRISDKALYETPSAEQMLEWQSLAIKILQPHRVRVIPQTHKFIGQL
jgi:7-carboxy-7-deazaguanine synthase